MDLNVRIPRKRYTLIFFVSISILLTSISVGSSGEPSGPMAGEPEITLVIEQESVKVYVDPDSDGIVTLTGEVTCEMPSYIPNNVFCVVNLRGDAGGWPVSVPAELTFSKSISVNHFSMSVQVPLKSSVDESRDVFVSGTWYYSPGNQGGSVNSDSAYIEVQPYSYIEIQNTDLNISLTGGSSKTVQVSLINTGNSNAPLSTPG